jgi:hypothetical protein
MNGYNGMLIMFHNVFDFSKLGYKRYAYIHRHYAFHHRFIWCYILILTTNTSLNDLQEAPENGKDMLYCHLKTDGFSTCLLFARSKKYKSSESKLELEDFNEIGVEKHFQPLSLDTRRKHVLTAVINDEINPNQI